MFKTGAAVPGASCPAERAQSRTSTPDPHPAGGCRRAAPCPRPGRAPAGRQASATRGSGSPWRVGRTPSRPPRPALGTRPKTLERPGDLGGRVPGDAAENGATASNSRWPRPSKRGRKACKRPAGGHCRVSRGSLFEEVRPTGRTSGPICRQQFGRRRLGPTTGLSAELLVPVCWKKFGRNTVSNMGLSAELLEDGV